MEPSRKLNILICPLGWGLGHASRDIPIIELLQQQGHNVIVAADKSSITLVKQRFPGLKYIDFRSLRVRYTKGSSQLFPLLWVAVRLPFVNFSEHRKLKQLIGQHKVDMVISDNRYGLWSNHVKTAIITHQLRVIPPFPFKWTLKISQIIIKKWLNRFDQVWVPDYSDERNIAGLLSRPNGLKNLNYIGILSRFGSINFDAVLSGFQMVVIASGPEPQRQIYIDITSKLAKKWLLSCLIVEGIPDNGSIPRNIDGIWYVGHLPDLQFALAVKNAQYLIFRGGYSTIMDMLTLGISGLMVPTPGQTEQEYLAHYLYRRGYFETAHQGDLPNIDKNKIRAKSINSAKLTAILKDIDLLVMR
ncbi:MAG: glycosyltransferase [Bacteroidales bacterium]